MANNAVVWIVVAVVVVLLLGVVAFLANKARDRKRVAESDRIRDEVREENARVEKRAAIAAETDAKARAAAAEAEAKAAEAARLADRAAVHRDEVASSREGLDTRMQHADSLDPRRKDDPEKAYQEAEKDRAKRDELNHAEEVTDADRTRGEGFDRTRGEDFDRTRGEGFDRTHDEVGRVGQDDPRHRVPK
jgi:hypothetical protein